MLYSYTQAAGEQISLRSQGTQTVFVIEQGESSEGMLASNQQATYTTGIWVAPPTLLRLEDGLLVRIETARGEHFFRLDGGRIQPLAAAPSLASAEVLPLALVETIAETTPTQAAQPAHALAAPSLTITLPPQVVPAVTTAILSASNLGREAVRAATQAAQTTSLPSRLDLRGIAVPRGLWSALLIAFILPFVTVSCGPQSFTFTGTQLAFGTTAIDQHIGPQFDVLLPLIAAVVGLVLTFRQLRRPNLFAAITSGIAALCLLFFKLRFDLGTSGSGVPIRVSYQIGYWLATLASLATFGLSMWRARERRKAEQVAENEAAALP